MLRRWTFAPLTVLLLLFANSSASAQDSARPEGAPAHVSFVEGVATLEREGRIDDAPQNMPLLSGDRVRTRGGRVEILFADGSTLHLDQNSAIDLQSDELVRLLEGRVRLSIPGPARDISYRIDAPFAWARIADAGEYRVSLSQNSGQAELEMAVIRGQAELVNEDGRTPLRAGERAFARAGVAPSYAYVFNSAQMDGFDRWSEGRRSERLGLSTQYLPEEVRAYSSSFDRYGSWGYDASYGNVWYPRVEVGWRPYYYGRWVPYGHYGYSWVSSHAWGWPTHHYGRWGFSAGVWFWIPGRTWGPAWVSWAYAPGYVSWCPLGWNNRPIYYVNGYHGYNPWRAWTVVPRHHFGAGYVHRSVVAGDSIGARTRQAFQQGDRAPATGNTGNTGIRGNTRNTGNVGNTGARPIRVAGTGTAVPRATPLLTNRDDRTGAYRSRTAPPAAAREADAVAGAPTSAEATVGKRAVPSQPVVRSERDTRYQPPAPVPGRENESPIYQRPDGYRSPDQFRATPETYAPDGRGVSRQYYGVSPNYGQRPNYGASPRSSEPRDDAAPPYSRPPSYGRPSAPESHPSGRAIERQGPAPSRPSAPEQRSSPPPPRSGGGGEGRPRADAPSRGTAVPRGGGRGGR